MEVDDSAHGFSGGPDDPDNQDEDESKMEIIRLKKQREKKRRLIDKQSAFIEFKALAENGG